MDAEDSELVVRSKHGDLNAFNFIVQRYQSQVLNLSARNIGDRGHVIHWYRWRNCDPSTQTSANN